MIVVLNDATPELLREFSRVSPRARAERLRALATIGLRLDNRPLGSVAAGAVSYDWVPITPVGHIKVMVTLSESNPELIAEFKNIPARAQAERIRTLATIGLHAVGGTFAGTPQKNSASHEVSTIGPLAKPDKSKNLSASIVAPVPSTLAPVAEPVITSAPPAATAAAEVDLPIVRRRSRVAQFSQSLGGD